MQWKARRTLHVFVVPYARGFLGRRCCAFGCHAKKTFPSGAPLRSGLSFNSRKRTPGNEVDKVTEVIEQMGLTAFL